MVRPAVFLLLLGTLLVLPQPGESEIVVLQLDRKQVKKPEQVV